MGRPASVLRTGVNSTKGVKAETTSASHFSESRTCLSDKFPKAEFLLVFTALLLTNKDSSNETVCRMLLPLT